MRALEACAHGFVRVHPEDTARLIEQHPVSEAALFLEGLDAVPAAGVIERMSPVAAANCLASMSPQGSASIIAALTPIVAAALLRRLTAAQRDAVLSHLRDETKEGFRRHLSYPDGTVGAITDPGVLALPRDLSMVEALRQLRRHHEAAHHHVYVVDRAQRLVGVVHIRDLVGRRSRGTLAGIMRPASARVAATSRLASAVAHPAWRELDTLPVTDDSGVLVGMVRFRQLRQLDVAPGPGDLADTLLDLGELYWVGLLAFLPGVRGDFAAREPASEPSEGGHHDA